MSAIPTSKQTMRPCPVCGSREAEVLHHQAFVLPDGCPLPSAYDLVACSSCGMVYADTNASQDLYDKYYTECSRYEDPSTSSGGGDRPDDLRRLEDTADHVLRWVPGRDTPILDIGCGNGGLIGRFAALGCTSLCGVDPSAACVERVAGLGASAAVGTVFSPAGEDAGKYGCVTLCHVLEHVRDVVPALRCALTWLGPGGTLYIETPDASRYSERYVVPFYYFDIEHINHFDPASLTNLARVLGLEAIDVTQKDVPLDEGQVYPCVAAVLRRPLAALQPSKAVRSSVACDAVSEYVRKSRAVPSTEELADLVASEVLLAVWGAGSFAQRLLTEDPLRGAQIGLIVDRDSKKRGTSLAGVTVTTPETLRGFAGPIVVCAALRGAEIEREIRAMGLENHVLVVR